MTVAVLGTGGVGGVLAAWLDRYGRDVVCVAHGDTAEALRQDGLTLEWRGELISATPHVVEELDEAVTLLVVAVKAYDLDDALARIDPASVARGVVLPLLNGLEHLEPIRERLGSRVAAGSISRFEGYRMAPTHVVQASSGGRIAVASGDLSSDRLRHVVETLSVDGIEVVVEDSERGVLWDKAARLGVLSAATAASGLTLGELRSDTRWRPRLEAALQEACAVARADGVPLSAETQWEMLDSLPSSLTTSAARDVAGGRPSELDAITGSVVRAASRLGVPCPTLEGMLAECEAP